ncbi:MAG TPA: 4-hydroxythreonine-4-phosphate dehydrogenase PdxA [Roseiarcus sp.]
MIARSAPIALSLGDPAGIGPEIVAGAWRALKDAGPAFVVIGDAATVAQIANAPRTAPVANLEMGAALFAERLPVLNMPLPSLLTPGIPQPASAPSIIGWIEAAAKLALSGEASALVTAPIAKAPLYQAGFAFPGHTEFLGAITGGVAPVMMLTAADLRVALVTIHEPLAKAPGMLTREKIVAVGKTTTAALRRDFGLPHPRLAVAALNPHAGEAGTLGTEEMEIIAPAVQALREAGIDAAGPYPADTLFHTEARARFDAVLCMYHDQALIPVKMLDFWGGVNVTLGLPIVRTSPDHGVAYDLVGKGLARPDSLIAALRLAAEIAIRRGQW